MKNEKKNHHHQIANFQNRKISVFSNVQKTKNEEYSLNILDTLTWNLLMFHIRIFLAYCMCVYLFFVSFFCRWPRKFVIVTNDIELTKKIENNIQEYSKNVNRNLIDVWWRAGVKRESTSSHRYWCAMCTLAIHSGIQWILFRFQILLYRIFSRHIGQGRPLCKSKLCSWSLGGHKYGGTAPSYSCSCVCACLCRSVQMHVGSFVSDADLNDIMKSEVCFTSSLAIAIETPPCTVDKLPLSRRLGSYTVWIYLRNDKTPIPNRPIMINYFINRWKSLIENWIKSQLRCTCFKRLISHLKCREYVDKNDKEKQTKIISRIN